MKTLNAVIRNSNLKYNDNNNNSQHRIRKNNNNVTMNKHFRRHTRKMLNKAVHYRSNIPKLQQE